jgi:hypothetical protein
MFRRVWRPAALAAAALLVGSGEGRASDVIRLGGKHSAKTEATASNLKDAGATVQRLDLKADAEDGDTQLVHRYRGGWGGHRGFYGGWGGYRGYYGGWGGHRGYYGGWGGYRPGISINFGYSPRYYGGYYGGYWPRSYGYGYGWGYSSYYSYPAYSYYSPVYYGGFCPIGGAIGVEADALTLDARPQQAVPQSVMPQAREYSTERAQPAPQQQAVPQPSGTFPYDGGPTLPVPAPRPDANAPQQKAPAAAPAPTERMVSIPAKKPYAYAAYGEHRARPAKPNDGTIFVRGTR